MTVSEGLERVLERIRIAAARAGRDPSSVRLLAVSKRHSVEAIGEAYAAGQRDFGENYVQEMVAKAEALMPLEGLRWHFIGHLQRNKAKDVLRVGAVVETVDSERLARALAEQADRRGADVEVWLQVNVAGEERKSGCAPEDVEALIASIRSLPALHLVGLTTIPPFSEDPEASRPYFKALREMAERYGLSELSMGMSGDLEVAIEEGATLVRVGTAIFGERPSTR